METFTEEAISLRRTENGEDFTTENLKNSSITMFTATSVEGASEITDSSGRKTLMAKFTPEKPGSDPRKPKLRNLTFNNMMNKVVLNPRNQQQQKGLNRQDDIDETEEEVSPTRKSFTFQNTLKKETSIHNIKKSKTEQKKEVKSFQKIEIEDGIEKLYKDYIRKTKIENKSGPGSLTASSNEVRIQTLRKFYKQFSYSGWIIYPDDKYKKIWDFFVVSLLLYTAIVLPYRVAFLDEEDSLDGFAIFENVMNAFFTLDIIITFFAAYYDQNENLILDKHRIARNYLTSWFMIDLISVMPIQLISDEISRNYNSLTRIVRLPRLLKIIRMTRLVKLTRVIKEKNKILSFFVDVLKIQAGSERLFLSVITIIIACHTATCFWKLMLVFEDDDINSWEYRFPPSPYTDNPHPLESYMICFYFILQSCVTTGYGDVNALTLTERIFTICWMFIGCFIYSFIIGALTSVLSNVDTKFNQYQENLKILLQIKKEYHFSSDLFRRVNQALKYGKKTNSLSDYSDFLKDLPQIIKIDLILAMNEQIIQRFKFFQDKPNSFLAAVLPLLKPIKIEPMEMIFIRGDPATEVYFLLEGTVDGIIPLSESISFITVDKGRIFGDIDILFYKEKRKYTMLTREGAEVLSLSKRDFKKLIFLEFRELGKEIYKNSLKKSKIFRNAYRKALVKYRDRLKERKNLSDSELKNQNQKKKLEFLRFESRKNLDESNIDAHQEKLELESKSSNEEKSREDNAESEFIKMADNEKMKESQGKGEETNKNESPKKSSQSEHRKKKRVSTHVKLFDELIQAKMDEKALLEDSDDDNEVPLIQKPVIEEPKVNEKKEKFNKELEEIKKRISNMENKIEILKSYTKNLYDKLRDDGISEVDYRKRMDSTSSRLTMENDKRANPQENESAGDHS